MLVTSGGGDPRLNIKLSGMATSHLSGNHILFNSVICTSTQEVQEFEFSEPLKCNKRSHWQHFKKPVIITDRNSSCGKAMFLQVCVCQQGLGYVTSSHASWDRGTGMLYCSLSTYQKIGHSDSDNINQFSFRCRQNSQITSIDTEVILSSWKEFAAALLVIGSKEMIWIICFVTLCFKMSN